MRNILTECKRSYETRSIVIAIFTSIGNFGLSVAKFTLGIILNSYYLCLIAGFTFIVGVMKYSCASGIKKALSLDKQNGRYIRGGFAMVGLGAIYMLYMMRLLGSPIETRYNAVYAIAIASMAFLGVVLSIVGAVRLKKKNILLKEIKLLAFATSLTDIALSQIAILSFTNPIDMSYYNGLFGMLVGIIIAFVGLYIIIDGQGRCSHYHNITLDK